MNCEPANLNLGAVQYVTYHHSHCLRSPLAPPIPSTLSHCRKIPQLAQGHRVTYGPLLPSLPPAVTAGMETLVETLATAWCYAFSSPGAVLMQVAPSRIDRTPVACDLHCVRTKALLTAHSALGFQSWELWSPTDKDSYPQMVLPSHRKRTPCSAADPTPN
jgi:hypothetical protein